jgi:hypothetical protein
MIERLELDNTERLILRDALYAVSSRAEREAEKALSYGNKDAHQHYINRAQHAHHLVRKLKLGSET